jgi:hypothetical protein
VSPAELPTGAPIVLYLREPKEKIWGLLGTLTPSGVLLLGIDLASFEDWMRQEARGEETLLGLVTLFYPMHRIERLERDETVGPVISYAERFSREVGRTVEQTLGVARARAN